MPWNRVRPFQADQGRRHAAVATLIGTGATVAITVGQAFLLIPLALARLGTETYGSWLAASELLVWVQLLDFGIPNLLTQRIGAAVGRRDAELASRWTWTGLTALLIIGLLLATVATWVAPSVTRWANVSESIAVDFTASFEVGAVASALILVSNGVVGVARGAQLTGMVNAAQVSGALAGLVSTLVLLVMDVGIWSFPIGLLARAVVNSAGAGWFLVRARRNVGLVPRLPSRSILRETISLGPSMAAASAGYLVANNTEIILVTSLFGPVTAAVYTLTRRGFDAARNLLDSIAWAVYGGFAHLVTADDRHRARGVLRDILWLRLAGASICGAIIVAVNESFVSLLFGPENFGGMWLTIAFALQMILGGQAFLCNYLLRAAGRVREGSYLLGAESALRLAAIVAGLMTAGLAGGPLAAALVSGVTLLVTFRYIDRELPGSAVSLESPRLAAHVSPAAVLGIGLVLSAASDLHSWPQVALAAMLTLALGAGVFWVTAPPLLERSLFRWSRS